MNTDTSPKIIPFPRRPRRIPAHPLLPDWLLLMLAAETLFFSACLLAMTDMMAAVNYHVPLALGRGTPCHHL